MYFIFKVFFIFLFMHALLGSAGCCVFWGSNRVRGVDNMAPKLYHILRKLAVTIFLNEYLKM